MRSLFTGSGRDTPICFVLFRTPFTGTVLRRWVCSEKVKGKRLARRLIAACDIRVVSGRAKRFEINLHSYAEHEDNLI